MREISSDSDQNASEERGDKKRVYDAIENSNNKDCSLKEYIYGSSNEDLDDAKINYHNSAIRLKIVELTAEVNRLKELEGISLDRVCFERSDDPTCNQDYPEIDEINAEIEELSRGEISIFPNCHTDTCYIPSDFRK